MGIGVMRCGEGMKIRKKRKERKKKKMSVVLDLGCGMWDMGDGMDTW